MVVLICLWFDCVDGFIYRVVLCRWFHHWLGADGSVGAASCKPLDEFTVLSDKDKAIAQAALGKLGDRLSAQRDRQERRILHGREMMFNPEDGLSPNRIDSSGSVQSSPTFKSSPPNKASSNAARERDELDLSYAQMYWATAMKPAANENPHAENHHRIQQKYSTCDWMPPRRNKLRTKLLDRVWTDLRRKAHRKLNITARDVYITISSDGWNNPKRQVISPSSFSAHQSCRLIVRVVS